MRRIPGGFGPAVLAEEVRDARAVLLDTGYPPSAYPSSSHLGGAIGVIMQANCPLSDVAPGLKLCRVHGNCEVSVFDYVKSDSAHPADATVGLLIAVGVSAALMVYEKTGIIVVDVAIRCGNLPPLILVEPEGGWPWVPAIRGEAGRHEGGSGS